MCTQKKKTCRNFCLLFVLTLFLLPANASLAEQKTADTPQKTNAASDQNSVNLKNTSEQKEGFLGDWWGLTGLKIKYSPRDTIIPYMELPDYMSGWKKFKQDMVEKHGTKIGIVLDNHYQQILNGPGSRKGRHLLWWNLTIEQKLDENSEIIFKARGSTQDGDRPHAIQDLVNPKLNLDWAAFETEFFYIANLYYRARFLDDRLMVAIGKITFPSYFDENKVAGWDFLSCSLARNGLFPHRYHSVGALARYNLTDNLYVQAGITDAQSRRSETGINTAFHDEDYFLSMAEVGVKTKDKDGLESNYRFDLWYDPKPLSPHDGGDPERDTTGFGFNFDRMLSEDIGIFFRYGYDDGRVRKFSHFWSAGGTCKGIIPQRKDDLWAIGIGQGITHSDYRRANNYTHTETIVETYYKMKMSSWCWLFFDLQALFNPGLTSSNDTSIIPGVKVKMVF